MSGSRRLLVATVVAGVVSALGWAGGASAGTAGGSPLIVVDSIVQGSTNAPRERVCVLNSRYLHGEEIVWRIKVIDPVTGEAMDDKQLKRVWVELADGQVVEARYGPHPRTNPTDYFWATSWVIPPGYPSGVLDYTIYAEAKDGRTGSNVKFEVESSMLVILPGSATK
ncbi:MAG: hypothetical protein AB1609_14170 [Bacillota bacterium]